MKPITNENEIDKEREILENLSYFEDTIKLLIASIYNSKRINPVDYILSTIKIELNVLKEIDMEFSYIKNYIGISNKNYLNKIKNIFKIKNLNEENKRENENENENEFYNKNLLFHGSKVFNFLGIITKGLKISPREAPKCGNIYGNGIYFADNFEKSLNYCDYFEYFDENVNKTIRNKYMLLCEVALGKVYDYRTNPLKIQFDQNFNKISGNYYIYIIILKILYFLIYYI
jgi:hypothetical protein